MVWTLNKNGVTPARPLTAAEQSNLNTFMNKVREGFSPSDAAGFFDSNYKQLGGGKTTAPQYQIRLSQANRATFTVNLTTQTVTMLGVGGHT